MFRQAGCISVVTRTQCGIRRTEGTGKQEFEILFKLGDVQQPPPFAADDGKYSNNV